MHWAKNAIEMLTTHSYVQVQALTRFVSTHVVTCLKKIQFRMPEYDVGYPPA